MPRGANPIDFAYAVHTDVGNHCVGCKINGRHVPLISELRNGDEVEILVSDAQTPPPAWENLAITGKARSAIRRATRHAIRKQYNELGRQILKRAFSRIDRDYDDEILTASLHRLSQKTVEDVLSAVGRGELASADVIAAAFPEAKQAREEPPKRRQVQRHDEGWFNLRKVIGLKFRLPGGSSSDMSSKVNGIPIRGHKGDLPVTFSEGNAIPGDRIVGILTPGEGIMIYPIHSPKLKEFDDESERWIDVTWDIDETNAERFPARIEITGLNEPGTLAQIARVIGEADGNIDNVKMIHRAPDFTIMVIELEVWDLRHLNEIISGLRAQSVVNSVSRAKS